MSHSQKSDAPIIETLRQKGYKATPQRIAICRFALHSRDHPTAQRIYDEVRKVYPTVSLATVYKTLQILTEHGLIQELDFPESQARFDSYVKPHINLVCLRCGNIQDLDDPATREMVARITVKAEFTRTGQRLDIYGICKMCHNGNK
ncbi:MAG TPA: Fur family transcriptional regulator [Candidatus Bathyarchaeia archaeon]|jgi:Fur family peroxide stress response transcriptional regulator|nr:Fur family transcriptional regulator [Candidatus Bathyarchaeia archaeon]